MGNVWGGPWVTVTVAKSFDAPIKLLFPRGLALDAVAGRGAHSSTSRLN
jgi:hypothetical protein